VQPDYSLQYASLTGMPGGESLRKCGLYSKYTGSTKGFVAKAIAFISVISIILVILSGCGASGTNRLKPVEIKEYQGEKLSSIYDFRENSIKGPQHIDITTYKLNVTGLVENPAEYTYDDVVNNYESYEKVVRLDCVEGWSVTILWQGVLVKDLLAEARVKPEAKVVIFHAYDGYTTSMPVDYIINNDILMAYKMNGVTLPAERGYPFELVAESKWGYKWEKWVTQIELSDNENYRGYWESRGYSNSADLNEGFFEK
jgi:DMSO/TMAO reductase YedYZ molybdopterin-dependent catalytic subunit